MRAPQGKGEGHGDASAAVEGRRAPRGALKWRAWGWRGVRSSLCVHARREEAARGWYAPVSVSVRVCEGFRVFPPHFKSSSVSEVLWVVLRLPRSFAARVVGFWADPHWKAGSKLHPDAFLCL